MAVNEELDAYLRGLYGAEPVEFAPDLTPTPMALEERPRFRNMLEGEVDPVTGETVRPSALQRIRETAEIGAAQDRREADLLAEQAGLALLEGGGVAASGERAPLPRGISQPPPAMGYLDALTEAQQQDALAASLRRLNDPAEQLARIQSRGIYQPMGLAAAPSAVSQLQQRQQAVADFLRQQREERTEARMESREQRADMQTMANMARAEALNKAQQLKDALAAGRQPFEIAKLKAETEAAANRAALYGRQAQEVGKPKPAAARAAAPKAQEAKAPTKRMRELPAQQIEDLAGIDVAVKELSDLTASYKKAGLGGLAGFAKSQFGIASSDAAKLYEASASPVRQAIGVILEGGKLAEGDIKRYLDMMPKPGDSNAVADQKLESLSRVLGRIKDAKIKSFSQAGFDVGTMAPAAAQPTVDLKKQTEDALDALEKAKREGRPADEIEKLDAEAGRLFELYQQSLKGS